MSLQLTHKGGLLVMVLVFGAIFLAIVTSFTGFVVTQANIQHIKQQEQQALGIAEAGLDYYRWYLAHNVDDVTVGTGLPGPYEFPYQDSSSTTVGYFSLDISSSTYCNTISSIDINATGWTVDNPEITRTLYARYAQPTVAEYAYIIDSNVWAGSDRTIIGPYHSNGGIRMDGTNNSIVTSGQETWTCIDSFGCSPDETVDGIFGAGLNSALWTFPSPPIDFGGLNFDMNNMRNITLGGDGIYIPNSGSWGYRVQYNPDNTITVTEVTDVETYDTYNSIQEEHAESNIIVTEGAHTEYALDPECPLVYVEDKVWLHGTTSIKSTIAAADPIAGNTHDIILHNNLVYEGDDAGILAVAEGSVLIGLVVPDVMAVNGIFIAQEGRFGRNHYESVDLPTICIAWFWWWCTAWDAPYDQYVTRDTLTINGTIVSLGRVGTKWTAAGTFVSGFDTRFNSYDRFLVDDPPPLVPNTSDDYRFIEWREVE